MKRWITPVYDEALAARLAREATMPPAMARIMARRGIEDAAGALAFARPRLADLSDPFALAGVRTAAERLLHACREGERVCVFGDYDVDGITSTALMAQVLARMGARARPFIPSRMEEGYGMSSEAVERCIAQIRPDLLVTVDCGVGATEAVATLHARGIDVIVTDHHDADGPRSQPLALVNPKIEAPSCCALLAGVGVAFKVCHGLVKFAREQDFHAADIDLQDYLPLVALGTVCDMVPLTDENRILVRHGIRHLRSTRNPGLLALMHVARVHQNSLSAHHLGFHLGPRLNAAGRLAEANASLRLLMTDCPREAGDLAEQLDQHNRERQQIEARMIEESAARILENFVPRRDFFLTLAQEQWHPGVVGIVASRLVQRFRRPCVVIAIDEQGIGRGSGRSIEGFNLLECLREGADLLNRFGGHAVAAGLEIDGQRIPDFARRMNERAARELASADLRAILPIDDWLPLGDINTDLFEWIASLAPFGMANPKPVLAARNIHLTRKRLVGRNHTRLSVSDGRAHMNAIMFGVPPEALGDGPCDIAFTLNRNSFRGQDTIELQIQDVVPEDPASRP